MQGGRPHPAAPFPDRARGRQAGFTLIEVMVVAVVIAVVGSAVAVGIGNIRGASVQSESGKLAITVRYLFNLAVLSGHNHRLVIDLDSGTYWGEEQTSADPCETFLLPEKADARSSKSRKRDADKEEEKTAAKGGKAGFSESKSKLLAKYQLDNGLSFARVMTSHQSEPSEKGQAYVYFFPNGTTENALIDVEGDPEDIMTVEVMALQGKATVHKERVSLDAFGDKGG